MERFRQAYASGDAEELPWYNPVPDPDLLRWFDALLAGPSAVIDLGAGPSVHGIWLAGRGHTVTAVDGIAGARDLALRLAAEQGVALDYHVSDVLAWEPPAAAGWDLALDRGFLHTLEPRDRGRWLAQVHSLVRPEGHVVVKAFTASERGFGPPGLNAAEMLEAIGEGRPDGLDLVSLSRTTFNLADDRTGVGPHSTWTLVARRA